MKSTEQARRSVATLFSLMVSAHLGCGCAGSDHQTHVAPRRSTATRAYEALCEEPYWALTLLGHNDGETASSKDSDSSDGVELTWSMEAQLYGEHDLTRLIALGDVILYFDAMGDTAYLHAPLHFELVSLIIATGCTNGKGAPCDSFTNHPPKEGTYRVVAACCDGHNYYDLTTFPYQDLSLTIADDQMTVNWHNTDATPGSVLYAIGDLTPRD